MLSSPKLLEGQYVKLTVDLSEGAKIFTAGTYARVTYCAGEYCTIQAIPLGSKMGGVHYSSLEPLSPGLIFSKGQPVAVDRGPFMGRRGTVARFLHSEGRTQVEINCGDGTYTTVDPAYLAHRDPEAEQPNELEEDYDAPMANLDQPEVRASTDADPAESPPVHPGDSPELDLGPKSLDTLLRIEYGGTRYAVKAMESAGIYLTEIGPVSHKLPWVKVHGAWWNVQGYSESGESALDQPPEDRPNPPTEEHPDTARVRCARKEIADCSNALVGLSGALEAVRLYLDGGLERLRRAKRLIGEDDLGGVVGEPESGQPQGSPRPDAGDASVDKKPGHHQV